MHGWHWSGAQGEAWWDQEGVWEAAPQQEAWGIADTKKARNLVWTQDLLKVQAQRSLEGSSSWLCHACSDWRQELIWEWCQGLWEPIYSRCQRSLCWDEKKAGAADKVHALCICPGRLNTQFWRDICAVSANMTGNNHQLWGHVHSQIFVTFLRLSILTH